MSKPKLVAESAQPTGERPVTFADRLAALDATRQRIHAERAAKQERLEREKRVAHTAAEEELSELQRHHDAALAALGRGIGQALQAALEPHVKAHRAEPRREIATNIGDALAKAGAECERWLGAELRIDLHLLAAFANAMASENPALLGALGSQTAVEQGLSPAHAAAVTLAGGDAGASVRALEALETALAQTAKRAGGDGVESRDRLNVIRDSATHGQCFHALEAVTARHALLKRERGAAERERSRLQFIRARRGEEVQGIDVEAMRNLPEHFGPLGAP